MVGASACDNGKRTGCCNGIHGRFEAATWSEGERATTGSERAVVTEYTGALRQRHGRREGARQREANGCCNGIHGRFEAATWSEGGRATTGSERAAVTEYTGALRQRHGRREGAQQREANGIHGRFEAATWSAGGRATTGSERAAVTEYTGALRQRRTSEGGRATTGSDAANRMLQPLDFKMKRNPHMCPLSGA